MIEIVGVTKIYKNRNKEVIANDNINLQIRNGEITALLGPNGAGKTTLIKQMVGILKPTCGFIYIDGQDYIKNKETMKSKITYVPQNPWILGDLSVYNALYIIARLNHKKSSDAKKDTEDFLFKFNMYEKKDRLIHSLSGGEMRILNFGYAIVGAADYFFLDEPTNDLSPGMRKILWDYIFMLKASGKTVFLVTHNLLDIQQKVDRVLFMNRGKIIIDDKPEIIMKNLGKEVTIYVKYTLPLTDVICEEIKNKIQKISYLPICSINNSEIRITVEAEQLNFLLKLLCDNKEIETVYIYPPSLEEVYHKIIVE